MKRLAASFAVAARTDGLAPGRAVPHGRGARWGLPDRDARVRRAGRPRHLVRPPRGRRVSNSSSPRTSASAPRGWTRSARDRDSLQALRKLAVEVDGEYRIRSDPPVLVPLRELAWDTPRRTSRTRCATVLATYRESLAPNRQVLFDHYRAVDVALKVVGVGSVGTRCWIVLLRGPGPRRPAVPPAEGGRATRCSRTTCPPARTATPGGGWSRASSSCRPAGTSSSAGRPGRRAAAIYVRQLRDGKVSADVDRMTPAGMQRLRRALRADPGPGPRPVRRRRRHRRLPRLRRHLRPGRGRVRRGLRPAGSGRPHPLPGGHRRRRPGRSARLIRPPGHLVRGGIPVAESLRSPHRAMAPDLYERTAPMAFAAYQLGEVLWTMFVLFMWIIWFWWP